LVSDVGALLPEGDSAVWIREGLSRLDLGEAEKLYGECGGVPYDPRGMLGILLYAYMEGEPGSRTIAKRCLKDVGYMHVGYGQKPDDRTIRRFRRLVGSVLPGVFAQVVQECGRAGLLSSKRTAVDGSKIASAASQMGCWLVKGMKEDVEQMGLDVPEGSDPDARSVGSSGRFVLGYNCQAAVDCGSGVTVALEVTNVNSDGHMLAPMVEAAVANAGQAPDQVVADAGYDTNEGASACASLGIEAVIAPQSPVGTFWTVTQEDGIVCPMGNPAVPAGVQRSHGKPVQVLRVAGCPACPFFKECCGASRSRSLAVPVGCDPVERLNAAYRARSPAGKEALRDRMAAIEPVFGDIKWNKGMSRFLLRGLDGARIEWTLQHMARNLTKLGKSRRRSFRSILKLLRHAMEAWPRPTAQAICPKLSLCLR